ncbi:MAG: VWA domain-containing protein [Acidobacteriota bacterium]
MTRVILGLLAALVLVAAMVQASERKKIEALPEEWRRWLEEEVYPLISLEQRKAFLELETDEQRKVLADRLWEIWAAETGIGPAFRSLYEDRVQECRGEFGNTTEDRARVFLLHGPPDVRKKIDCDEVFHPLEFWLWGRIEGLGQDVAVIFYRPYGVGKYRLWDPYETRNVLYNTSGRMALAGRSGSLIDRPEWHCGDAQEILRWLAVAEAWMRDLKARASMEHREVPGSAGPESATTRFLQFSTVVPKGSQPLDFELTHAVGGRRGGKLLVSFSTAVAREGLATAKVGDMEVVQLDVTGEISREGTMADRFRYAFTFSAESKSLPIAVEREVRPGRYRLRLKVADSNSTHAGLREADFEVAAPEIAAAPTPDAGGEAVVERVVAAKEATLALQGPEGEGIAGVQRFTALVGPKVAKVEFSLDGRPVLTKNRPPFEVELDLGPLPRLASVVVVALDGAGHELDRKQLDVNVGRERFMIRLQPVGKADVADGKVRASASVNVPSDRKLARVELYWGEQLLQTIFQPPFEAWLALDDPQAVGYLRALAVLEDGGQAEDVQFVNAPQFVSGVQVTSVHVPVVVLDKDKKPVVGLAQEDFEIVEDGVSQVVTHFSLQQELPVRLGLEIDTSGSMEKTLGEVQRVVLGFLRDLLRPRDRAFILAFSDRPAVLESFSEDFEALGRALIALRADRATAFYDAMIHGLFQFSGVRGRKALIVLTDGDDNASRANFDKTLDYAQRSGVCVYTIGIDLPLTQVRIRSQLSRLARTTGGEAFFLARDASLDKVYSQIDRELRSQYLIVYTSSSTAPVDVFRKVTVKVRRPDVEVRTIAGYYPGG